MSGDTRVPGEFEEQAAAPTSGPPLAMPDLALMAGPMDTGSVMAMQRSAGNSAVSGYLHRRSGDCGCTHCVAYQEVHGGADAHEFAAGDAAGKAPSPGGTEDERLEAGPDAEAGIAPEGERKKSEPAQAVLLRELAHTARARKLGRVANWAAGPVHAVNNLADCVINGTPAGVTWPTLNGTQFWSGAQALAALALPTLRTAAAASGGFESQVDVVPNNTGSFDETVLRNGPWRLNTTMAAVVAAVPALAGPLAAGGATRFRAYGDPSDAAMFAANRRHEDHHATDHRDAFNTTIVPWDTALAAAKTAGTKYPGASAAAAEAALWAAMGGTPTQVATAFFDACQAAVIAYHSSAAGGTIGAPTNPGSRNAGAISYASYTNPS